MLPASPRGRGRRCGPTGRREIASRGRRDGDGEGSGRSGASGFDRPTAQWTAFVKDHNVFVRATGKPEETRLSDDGKEGLAYGRLSWAPDSKTLVAFRIEPGDAQGSLPDPVVAPRRRPGPAANTPLPPARRQVHRLRAQPLRRRRRKQTKPNVDRVDFGSPRLRWHKDGQHFHLSEKRPRPPAVPVGRGRRAHRQDS